MRGKFKLKYNKNIKKSDRIQEMMQAPLAFHIHKARHLIDKMEQVLSFTKIQQDRSKTVVPNISEYKSKSRQQTKR